MAKYLMNITVLTATIPERSGMVVNAIDSVSKQNIQPENHIILVDTKKNGNFNTYQKLLEMADTEWVCFLDDDDIFYPNHLEKLIKNSNGYDVIYSNPSIVNDDTDWVHYLEPFSYDKLMVDSIVPMTALVKKDLILQSGGFKTVQHCDYLLWKALAQQGAKFNKIEDITWEYRFHNTNYSRKGKTW